jgi:ABC-type transport system involved in Fe-S cluster assembly fused permease/ATPase subunit
MSIVGTQLLTQILPMALQILIAGALVANQYDVALGSSLVLLAVVYAVYSVITAKAIIGVNKEFLDAWMAVSIKTQGALSRYKIMCEFDKFNETMHEIDTILTRCWSNVFVKRQTKPLHIGLGHITLSYTHMLWAVMYVGAGVKSGTKNRYFTRINQQKIYLVV